MATRQNHPLPAPPGQSPGSGVYYNPVHTQQQQQQQRPAAPTRKSRTFSFKSDKSQKSGGKISLHETPEEKEAKRLHSKADPSVAMNEAEPAAVAATVKSSLQPLRGVQHKDAYGNPIAEPDLSNPTRSRWERPLDTIRAFEAAIDGGYNRKSYIRSDTESVADWGNNRRSSYFPSNGGPAPRFPHDSYYGSRPASSFRPDMAQRGSYYDQQGGYYGGPSHGQANGYGPPVNGGRRGNPRMSSDPQFYGNRQDANAYPLPNNHRSYETVASGSGSGTSGEPAGYQTDPTSSDNSSIERRQSPPKPPPMNDYGIGFSQGSSYQPQAFSVGVNHSASAIPRSGLQYEMPPPVPEKGAATLRKPVAQASQRPAAPEKRKSWLARRFSKN